MISTVLVVADLSWKVSLLIPDVFHPDVFQMIRNHSMSVNAILLSCLLEPFKKNLGPNTLYLLMGEEKKTLKKIEDYFAGMSIPYNFKVVTANPWEAVLNEVEGGNYDLIILQGEFLKMWNMDGANYGLCAQSIHRINCPVLVINNSHEDSLSYPDFDFRIS